MIQFTKPASLNGAQLCAELASAGIVASQPTINGDGKFWLDIKQADVAKASPIVAAHVAIDPAIAQAQFDKDLADGIAKLEALNLTHGQAQAVAHKK